MSDPGIGLDRNLFREGYRFEFFQAVRLLERLHPERKRVGHHEDPAEEVVRFRSRHSLAFPASEIHEIDAPESPAGDEAAAPDTMWVNFMGLAGLNGAMPRHFSEMLADPGLRAETAALSEFLDLFNHRLVSLFYRAWEKYRFAIAYERGGRDTFSQYLYCLIGLGTPGLQGRLRIDDQILLYYAGLLAQRPRSAVALQGILEDYFGVPVEVVQFQGQWFEMNADILSSLGAGGQNNQLGVSAVLWERIFDPQARFRINVGPLSYRQFLDFLPPAPGPSAEAPDLATNAYVHLVELTRFFVGEDVNFEVRPVLRREEVPWCVLGGPDTSIRLGWSMWLKDRELDEEVAQPIFGARLASSPFHVDDAGVT
jgi:type VI secretion system protein ImpH